MRKLLDDNGLKCCGTHTGLDTLEGDALAKTIEYNKTIGNKFLIVPWIPEERRKTADDWKKLAAAVRRARGQGRPRGDARRLPQPQRRVHAARRDDAVGPLLRRDEEVGHPAGGPRQLHRRRRRPGRPHQALPGPHGHHPHQGVLEDEAGRVRRRGRRAVEGASSRPARRWAGPSGTSSSTSTRASRRSPRSAAAWRTCGRWGSKAPGGLGGAGCPPSAGKPSCRRYNGARGAPADLQDVGAGPCSCGRAIAGTCEIHRLVS